MIALQQAKEPELLSTAVRVNTMEIYTLECTRDNMDMCQETELRGVFTSYQKARDAINVKGYWTTLVDTYGSKIFEGFDPYFKDEFGGEWFIYKTVIDVLLPSDWSIYA